MKTKRLWSILVCLLLIAPLWADRAKRDAAHLQAFFLTGELLDYAARVNSPRAYLMAVELMLEHPVGSLVESAREVGERSSQTLAPVSRPDPAQLLDKAAALNSSSSDIQGWTEELRRRLQEGVRVAAQGFAAGTFEIRAHTVHRLNPQFQANRLSHVIARSSGSDLRIQVQDRSGATLVEGINSVSFQSPRRQRLRVTVENRSDQKFAYELLIH